MKHGISTNEWAEAVKNGDTRYNTPKKPHEISEEVVDQAIADNEIYDEVRERILNTQRKQVGYGLAKYPETLNPDTWTTEETIDHAMDEAIDLMHYLQMLKLKLESKETPVESFTYPEDILNKNSNYMSELLAEWVGAQVTKAILNDDTLDIQEELSDKDKELLVDTFKKTSLYKELFSEDEDWNVEDNSGKQHKIGFGTEIR